MENIDKWIDNNENINNKNNKFLKQFNNKFILLKTNINSILEEFKSVYPYAKVYPNSERYQKQLQTIESNIQNANSETFLLNNEISQKIININKIIKDFNIELKKEKKLNTELKKKQGDLEEGVLSSDQLFEDEKTTYQTNIVNIIIYVIAYVYIGKNIYKLIKK
jgi:hypothetical protein